MEYLPELNLLLEALTYLGARANGHTLEAREERLRRRGLEDVSAFSRRVAPVARLQHLLDEAVSVPEELLDKLFRDVEGFPFNTNGSYSLAFLLFYPALGQFDGDLDGLVARLRALTPDQTARNLLLSLSMDDLTDHGQGCADRFLDSVLTLTIPADSRLALVGALRTYPQLLEEAARCLRPVLSVLQQQRPQLEELARELGGEMAQDGPAAYLQSSSGLSPDGAYLLRPYILGFDTNLSLDAGAGRELIYCGIHRRFLQQLLADLQGSEARVFAAIKLLGDRTRFDILCFLRDHPAYGQELSDHFGLARNTIHHHMSKLLNAGLVTCTVEGNRVYYDIDRPRLDGLLQLQRSLLLGDRP